VLSVVVLFSSGLSVDDATSGVLLVPMLSVLDCSLPAVVPEVLPVSSVGLVVAVLVISSGFVICSVLPIVVVKSVEPILPAVSSVALVVASSVAVPAVLDVS